MNTSPLIHFTTAKHFSTSNAGYLKNYYEDIDSDQNRSISIKDIDGLLKEFDRSFFTDFDDLALDENVATI